MSAIDIRMMAKTACEHSRGKAEILRNPSRMMPAETERVTGDAMRSPRVHMT